MKPTPLQLCLGLLLLEGARADLLFYEGFDYAPGEDRLQAAGYTPSTPGADGDVIEGSLGYVDAAGNRLRTTGNRASLDATEETANVTDVRPLNLAGAKTNTVWFSCVGQQTGGGLAKFFNVSIRTVDDSVLPADTNKADDELIAIGLPATADPAPPARWGLTDRSAGEGRRFIYFPTRTTEKAFLVVRVELNQADAKERFTMWVNLRCHGKMDQERD